MSKKVIFVQNKYIYWITKFRFFKNNNKSIFQGSSIVMVKIFNLLGLCFILILIPLGHTLNDRRIAQASPKSCSTNEKYEPASKTYRTARLPEFRIEIDIPSNYKTMKRRDGSVWIVHRLDFEHLQCIAKGGGGGRGLYYEDIRLVDRDRSVTLKDRAIKLVGNNSNLPGIRFLKYQKDNISGYLIDIPSPAFNHAAFVGTIKG
jgi:hypothetical protein